MPERIKRMMPGLRVTFLGMKDDVIGAGIACSLLAALATPAMAQEVRIPLFAKGNEPGRPGLYITVAATVNDGSATTTSTATRIIVDTGSSELSLPAGFFSFPGGVPPASYGTVKRLVSFTDSSLWGVRVPKATVTLGDGGANSITIKNAPINIITKRCVAGSCTAGDSGAGIIGINYQDSRSGSNVLRWAESPFQGGWMITTSSRNLVLAGRSAEADRVPIGHLHLGQFNTAGFKTLAMTRLGSIQTTLPGDSPTTIWSARLPGACVSINGRTYGSATANKIPVPLDQPVTSGACQAEVVADSGGKGGLMHFPGPLPAGVKSRGNRSLAVRVPGVFFMPLPVEPQRFPIQANMGARNPNLVVNTGFRFFNDFDFTMDAHTGLAGMRAKGISPR